MPVGEEPREEPMQRERQPLYRFLIDRDDRRLFSGNEFEPILEMIFVFAFGTDSILVNCVQAVETGSVRTRDLEAGRDTSEPSVVVNVDVRAGVEQWPKVLLGSLRHEPT
jgi:hypothetical protein